jgi:hypothetical protein
MSELKPKRVKARITRTVTEYATVTLDKHGAIDELLETHEELFSDDINLIDVRSVISVHD